MDYEFLGGNLALDFTNMGTRSRNLTWTLGFFSSRDPKVATVDEYGTVTAVGSGHALIEARSGGLRAELPIEVDLISGENRVLGGEELKRATSLFPAASLILGRRQRALIGAAA